MLVADTGLDESADRHVGGLLSVEPIYGYGWAVPDGPALDVPPPFAARLIRIEHVRGKRTGGVARIEQPGHPFDGQWVSFSLRHVGRFDLATRPGHYNVSVLQGDPPPPSEWREGGAYPVTSAQGFGVVRAAGPPA